jgi:integrase
VEGLRPRTYATLIGLMASAGLRTQEALRLSREDANLDAGILVIRETKFQKSRLVPLDITVTHALREYAIFRDSYIPSARSPAFLLGEKGNHLSSRTVH